MKNSQNTDMEYLITEEEAFKLLYSDKIAEEYRNNVFDEFGNYVFSTDVVTSVPNTAVGTANGISFIS